MKAYIGLHECYMTLAEISCSCDVGTLTSVRSNPLAKGWDLFHDALFGCIGAAWDSVEDCPPAVQDYLCVRIVEAKYNAMLGKPCP